MSTVYDKRKRGWLRSQRSWGPFSSWAWHVHVNRYSEGCSLEGSFGIRDCSDEIQLDVCSSSVKQVNKHIVMIDKLQSEISKFRAELVRCRDTLDWSEK